MNRRDVIAGLHEVRQRMALLESPVGQGHEELQQAGGGGWLQNQSVFSGLNRHSLGHPQVQGCLKLAISE